MTVKHHHFFPRSWDLMVKCWNSDPAGLYVVCCELKMVCCWTSSFFISPCSRVKTNPHETGALVYDLLAGSLWEVIWRLSLGQCWISCYNRAATVRGSIRTPLHHGKPGKRSDNTRTSETRPSTTNIINQFKKGRLTILCSLERSCLIFHEGLHLCRLWGCEKEEKTNINHNQGSSTKLRTLNELELAPVEDTCVLRSPLIKHCEESNPC